MEENKKVILFVAAFVVVIALGIAIYFLFIQDKSKKAAQVPVVAEETALSEKELAEKKKAPGLIQVNLDESDGIVRELAKKLSSHPMLASWLISKDLIRKFVSAVDNIAEGQSPRLHITFYKPAGKFQVYKKNNLSYIDPGSYARYNEAAEVFNSLNSEGTVMLYRQLKPVIQEAYRELGYPDKNFDKTLTKAIVEMLNVPVMKDILVEKKVVSYKMVDSKIEKLSDAQKHLLRMGPKNVQIIQSKLREMAGSLEIPEGQLPQ